MREQFVFKREQFEVRQWFIFARIFRHKYRTLQNKVSIDESLRHVMRKKYNGEKNALHVKTVRNEIQSIRNKIRFSWCLVL